MVEIEKVGSAAGPEGPVLLVRRSLRDELLPGKWLLPGGMVEAGETVREAAIREVKEEVDIDLSNDSMRLTGIFHVDDFEVYLFSAKVGKNIKVSVCEELDGFAFVGRRTMAGHMLQSVPIRSDGVWPQKSADYTTGMRHVILRYLAQNNSLTNGSKSAEETKSKSV